ncbi:hypothetical protein PPL_10344 [Heterostelium album PN500]|uniref:RRM domain-containing protein n=1 Tax=Heterostelium pallidum (strain ATCC 26659 / Pp 5 / PN500) TaxID=670386 RepID=D3BQ24_HETP5|nr:hypothetical protein PPL_10344 [Heterostelium album PN500]EFA76575.1 hypothetical protein PPL_10344 [Heterostelium album PN500]|eukprot:XP_020428707.1 hypothetical protein PPL_10344 [Heterostelium album PN500]
MSMMLNRIKNSGNSIYYQSRKSFCQLHNYYQYSSSSSSSSTTNDNNNNNIQDNNTHTLNDLSSNPKSDKNDNIASIFTRLFGKTNEDPKINPTVDPKSIDQEELQTKKQQNPQRKQVQAQFYSVFSEDAKNKQDEEQTIAAAEATEAKVQPKREKKSLFGIDVDNEIDDQFINDLKESHPTPFDVDSSVFKQHRSKQEPTKPIFPLVDLSINENNNTGNTNYSNNKRKISFKEETDLDQEIDRKSTVQSSSSSFRENNSRFESDMTVELDELPMSDYTNLVQEYHTMLEQCKVSGAAPQFKQLNFMIENVPLDMEEMDMNEVLQKNFAYPIDDLYCEFIHDHSLKGDILSMLVVLRYHTNRVGQDMDQILEKINESVEKPASVEEMDEKQRLIDADSSPETIYEKFKLYGIICKGVRYKTVSPKSMMTLKVSRIPVSVNEELLRSHLEDRVSTLANNPYKILFIKNLKNAHVEDNSAHSGSCYINFSSHLDALQAFAGLHSISYDRKTLVAKWSRKIFSDGSDSSNLQTKLASAKAKNFKELAMLKKVMDLSAENELLKSQLEAKSARSTKPKQSSTRKRIVESTI